MSPDGKHEAGAGYRDAVCAPEPEQAHAPDMLGAYEPSAQPGGDGNSATSEPAAIDEVLDVERAARLLQIGRNTIYELVGRNEIPHRRLGRQIRFSRAAIMRWLDSWSSQDAKEGQ
jgi:excisionase family DNA binding protein